MRDDIAKLQIEWRKRNDLMQARIGIELRIMAICRRVSGEKVPLRDALTDEYAGLTLGLPLVREQLLELENGAERAALATARKLPEFGLIVGMRGFGVGTFAAVVGEAGDLANYSTHSKLWKRFGLAPFKGKALSTWRMSGGLTADEWKAAGYSPRRRSILFNFAESAIKVGGPYAELHRARKASDTAKLTAAGVRVLPGAELAKLKDKTGTMSLKQVDMRAKRYIAKAALRELWQKWRRAADVQQQAA